MELSKKDALYELYRRGNLTFKLDPLQKDLHERLEKTKEKVMTILCSRRLGKSYWALTEATMTCLKKPNSIVKILAPTKLMVTSILRPLIRQIIEDCPEEFRPVEVKNRYLYNFPNGSIIELAGSDAGHAEKLRGSFADLIIVDEAGFCDDLQNTVRSVLIPTTMNTKGKIILLSTPPKSMDHDFLKFVEESETNGTLIKKTIFDNPRVTKDEIQEIIKAYPAGQNDPEFRREFLCEIIKDPSLSVVPEFTPDLEKEIIKDWPRPPFFDSYEAMDLGGKDLTVVLFGYYDFRASKIIIEDEVVMNFAQPENHIKTLVDQIKEKEQKLWTTLSGEVKKPYLRVSDIDYIVLKEISNESHGEINFNVTKKDDKDAAINNLRILISSKKIIINPRCKILIRHLRNVKWASSNNKNKFARSPDDGHYDAVDAAIYFVRNIVFSKNPYPANYQLNMTDIFITNPSRFYTGNNMNIYKRIFNVKKR